MAKFTAGVPLDIEWANHSFVGVAGTTHRLTDALVEEFTAEVVPQIPGFAWVTQDELTSIVTLPIAQTDVTGLTAALADKYDKTGGTISGAATVTGTLGVQGAATMSAALTVLGAANLSSTLGVTGAATVLGAANLSSTLGVTGATILGAAATVIGAVDMSSSLGVAGSIRVGAATVAGKATFGNVLAVGSTTFPGSPADNDIYYRTDLDLLFFWNGTRWLSTTLYQVTSPQADGSFPFTVTTGGGRMPHPGQALSLDVWLEDLTVSFFVNGGTALGASHKWVGIFAKKDSGNSGTTLVTVNIDSGASDTWRRSTTAIDALLGASATYFDMDLAWTKTGTPGTLFAPFMLTYRLVAT